MEVTADPAGVRLFFKFAEERGIDLRAIRGSKAAYELSHAAGRIPACVIVDLLEEASHALDDEAFGIGYAQTINLRRLGPMGLLWEYSNNLAEVIRTTQKYVHVMNEAVALKVEWEHEETALIYTLSPVSRRGARHFTEALLVTVVRLIRQGLGESWAPLRIELSHSAPNDHSGHLGFFHSNMEFKSARNAIILKSDDLLRPFRKHDSEVLDVLKQQFDRMDTGKPKSFLTQVDRAATSLLTGGRISLANVARQLVIEPRTLQRRLRDHGVTFSDILLDLRVRRATEYFSQEPYPRLEHLAYLLGYSDISTTSRFLKAANVRSALRLPRRAGIAGADPSQSGHSRRR